MADGECMAVMKDYKPPSCSQSRNKDKAYCLVYKACKGNAMVEGNGRQYFVEMYDPEAARAVFEGKQGRKLGLYQSCNSNSDCQSGRCAGRVGKESLPARSRSVDSEDREARGMKCCEGSGCHNYPMGAYFTCQNNGGSISGRSVDSEEEKPARKLGLYQSCNSNSDCQSGRCAGRVGKECLPARSS